MPLVVLTLSHLEVCEWDSATSGMLINAQRAVPLRRVNIVSEGEVVNLLIGVTVHVGATRRPSYDSQKRGSIAALSTSPSGKGLFNNTIILVSISRYRRRKDRPMFSEARPSEAYNAKTQSRPKRECYALDYLYIPCTCYAMEFHEIHSLSGKTAYRRIDCRIGQLVGCVPPWPRVSAALQ